MDDDEYGYCDECGGRLVPDGIFSSGCGDLFNLFQCEDCGEVYLELVIDLDEMRSYKEGE